MSFHTDHFNELTPGQAERLALLLEELGEAQQAIGKILRHGYSSTNPIVPDSPDNRAQLTKELGDVQCAIKLLCSAGDLEKPLIKTAAKSKLKSVIRWMHHQ